MIAGIGNGGGFSGVDFNKLRENRFKKADADGDGKITKEELSAVLPKNGKGPSVDEIFSRVDTNNDGAIDATEDKAAFAAMRHHHHGHGAPDPAKLAAKVFGNVDTDSSGGISKDELTTALAKVDPSLNADDVIKMLDTNSDGAITQTELSDSLKKMFDTLKAADQAGGQGASAGCHSGYTNSGEGTAPVSDTSSFSTTA